MSEAKRVMYKGKMVEVLDMTPTWESILPLLLDNMRSENPATVKNAIIELYRLAQFADKVIAENKKNKT